MVLIFFWKFRTFFLGHGSSFIKNVPSGANCTWQVTLRALFLRSKTSFSNPQQFDPLQSSTFFSWCHAWTVTIGQRRWIWRTWENSNGTRSESETKNQNGFMICILSLKTLICSRTCAISLQEYSNRPIKFAHFRFQVVKILSCRFHRRGLF